MSVNIPEAELWKLVTSIGKKKKNIKLYKMNAIVRPATQKMSTIERGRATHSTL